MCVGVYEWVCAWVCDCFGPQHRLSYGSEICNGGGVPPKEGHRLNSGWPPPPLRVESPKRVCFWKNFKNKRCITPSIEWVQVRSDWVSGLTQWLGSRSKYQEKVCFRGPLANLVETWQDCYPHGDMDKDEFWTQDTDPRGPQALKHHLSLIVSIFFFSVAKTHQVPSYPGFERILMDLKTQKKYFYILILPQRHSQHSKGTITPFTFVICFQIASFPKTWNSIQHERINTLKQPHKLFTMVSRSQKNKISCAVSGQARLQRSHTLKDIDQGVAAQHNG